MQRAQSMALATGRQIPIARANYVAGGHSLIANNRQAPSRRNAYHMAIAGPKLERPTKLVNLLKIGLTTKPDAPALVSLERIWSWRELDQAATRLARHYLALGLAPGDRVASLMPNRAAL